MKLPVPSTVHAAEERCVCGNLVAKVTPAGVEILCRRCKRVHQIPWEATQRPRHARDASATRRRY